MSEAPDLSSIPTDELTKNLDTLLIKLDKICREIGPKLTELGHLREESQIIYKELEKRGEISKYVPPNFEQ